jgi:phage baseplate assembly protein W
MSLYRGISTFNRSKKFKVNDFELVKQDLLNHFNIRKGEKLMNPDFGSIVWSCLFEPFTESMRQAIINDVKTIINYDPRIGVTNLNVTEQQYGIQIQLELVYIPTDQKDTLNLKFDKESSAMTTGGR